MYVQLLSNALYICNNAADKKLLDYPDTKFNWPANNHYAYRQVIF